MTLQSRWINNPESFPSGRYDSEFSSGLFLASTPNEFVLGIHHDIGLTAHSLQSTFLSNITSPIFVPMPHN